MTIAERKKHHKPWKEWSIGSKIAAIAGGAVAGLGLMILFGFVFMWLWNALMPHIFGLPLIGYWEGWGLIVLAYILFGAKRGGPHSMAERRRRHKMRDRMRTLEEQNGDEDEKSKT
jgi:hypothetical protein